MTQRNSVNIKISISQLYKLKSAIKNATELTPKLSTNMIDDSNGWSNFPHKLLLIDKFESFGRILKIIKQLI